MHFRSTANCILLPISLGFTPAHLQAQTAPTADITLLSPQQLEVPAEFSFFAELYYHELSRTNTPGAGTRKLIFLSDFSSFYDTDAEQIVYTSQYRDTLGKHPDTTEHGILAFRMQVESEPSIGQNVAGFIRRETPWALMSPTPVEGKFTGWNGHMQKEAHTTNADLTISSPDGALTFAARPTLSATATDAINLGSFSLRIPESAEILNWSFSAATLNRASFSSFAGWIQRNDDNEPVDFWSTKYIALLQSEQDADQDGIPDIVDTNGNTTAFPWYADFSTSADWYWSVWMQEWVYSISTTDWDFWDGFGWVIVPSQSKFHSFWFYSANTDEWYWTSTNAWPALYRPSDGHYLHLQPVGSGRAWLYDYNNGSWL